MDWDSVQTQHHLETPNIIRRRRPGVLGQLTRSPGLLCSRSWICNLFGLVDFDNLGKLRLSFWNSKARVGTKSGLLVSNDLKNGPPRLFGLGTFLGLPFALWVGGFLGFLYHQLVRIDRWGHFRHFSSWDEVGMINGGAGRSRSSNKQNDRLDKRLFWARNNWAFEKGAMLGSVAEQ